MLSLLDRRSWADEQRFDLAPLRALCDLQIIDRAPSPGTLKAALLSLTAPQPVTMRLYHTPAMEKAIAVGGCACTTALTSGRWR